MGAAEAIAAVRARAEESTGEAEERWAAAAGVLEGEPFGWWSARFRHAGRLTVNFHPDRVGRDGRSVACGLAVTGRYLSQWRTWLSSGSRSAVAGGERGRFERALFGGAYDGADPTAADLPVYGALDLAIDPHGGSPRFGSSFVVLQRQVLERTTLCIGDSHTGPTDVGTPDRPACVLAGLAEQAAHGDLLGRGLGLGHLGDLCGGRFRTERPARGLDGYVEAQVHGGVHLERDVEAIVLDPSFRDTLVEGHVRVAAERYGFSVGWHRGSELHVDDVPGDFRGAAMPALARSVARADGVVDAHAIGVAASRIPVGAPSPEGDDPASPLQRLKHLWHTLLVHGRDAFS